MPFAVIGAAATVYAASSQADSQSQALDAQKSTADKQSQLGQETLDFNKKQYADSQAARDFALKNSQDVSTAQLSGMKFAADQAASDKAYNEGTFRPLEKGIVSDAQAYDTPQRRADAAAAAEANVDQTFDATHAATDRDLARSGIAPGSGKEMALQSDAAIAQAAARAGAGTTAIRNVENLGVARRADAANLGRNLPSNQVAQETVGNNAGTSSSLSGMQAVNAQQAGIPNVNAGFGVGANALNSAGGIYGGAARGFGDVNTSITNGIGSLAKAGGSGAFNGVGSWFTGLTSPGVTVDPGGASPVAGGMADGGPVRSEPIVGTKGPARDSGAGPMSTAALLKTLASAPAKTAPDGIAALPANPLTNPKAIIEGRLQGYAAGGSVGDLSDFSEGGGGNGGGMGMANMAPNGGGMSSLFRAPAAPVAAPMPAAVPTHNMSIMPVARGTADGAPMASTMGAPTVPAGSGFAPGGQGQIQQRMTNAAPIPAGAAGGYVPSVGPVGNVAPIGPGMQSAAAPVMGLPPPEVTRTGFGAVPQQATAAFARGGAVTTMPPVLTQAAPPVVPPAAMNTRAMPRMGGTPSAPANRGSYQSVPLSKGKAFAKGGMVTAVRNYAAGAAVRGPGGPRADAIPAMLSDGEHVLKTSTVNAIGGGSNNRGQAKLLAATKTIDKRARAA